jgi:nitrate/TMAO reductase-like tetraheme cytochrome c subunit
MTNPTEAPEPTEAPVPAEASEASVTSEATTIEPGKPKVRHFRRTRAVFAPVSRVLGKIPHPPWHSKRGVLVLLLLIGGVGTVVGVGGMTAISFSETPGFCGMCHTMDPELKAYAMSPHKDVTCAECHINPGLAGFVKAKANGTKQLADIIIGKFPTPIPPPDHADLPPVAVTCLKCHSLDNITENGGPVKLVLRPRYKTDEANTRETIAIMLRPAGMGQGSGTTGTPGATTDGVKGVHWHVQQKVTYSSGDVHAQKIDLVSITAKDGTTEQYIAGSQVTVSTDVKPDLARLTTSQTTKTMDCIDCHNRIGHGVPSPDRAIDEAIGAGKISTTLPFIKRDSVALLNGSYPTLKAADTAIDGLRATYAAKYPLALQNQAKQVTAAIDELKVQYRLIATPAMKVQAKTYPDNLGHQTSPGCFRCHDGAHYLVVAGKITNKTIPSECSTCHTFPQIGASASSFPLGTQPVTHKDKLYVFSHKLATKSADPTGNACGVCHAKTYCENCHKSGAIKVQHTAMLYNHAAAIKTAGGTQACAYCHLPVYCEKCHKGPVLDPATPPAGATPVALKPRPAT